MKKIFLLFLLNPKRDLLSSTKKSSTEFEFSLKEFFIGKQNYS